MTFPDLQAKYPDSNLKSEPLPNCPTCKGAGEFRNKAGNVRPCICVHLSGGSDTVRLAIVNSFRKTIANLRQELGPQA
jgi:hypothetical protein